MLYVYLHLITDKLQAKASAALAKRWLLANIQDATEFDSQKLNRDTWSDGELKKVISKNFVFWQRYHDSEDGRKYCRLYRQAEVLPHIGTSSEYYHF